jgi:hypothetical protein
MLQLNLLPDVKKEFLKAQRQRNLVMTSCILSILVAGGIALALGLFLIGQQVEKNIQMGYVERDKDVIEEAQEKRQLNEYLTIQNQLSQVDSLKESQLIYSRLFDFLQQLNPAEPNGVELSSVRIASSSSLVGAAGAEGAGAGGGSIELRGMTANFASLDVYKTTLAFTTITYSKLESDGTFGDSVTEPLFTAVAVTEAGLAQISGGDRVSFSITVVYDEAAFSGSSFYEDEESLCRGRIDKYCPGVTVKVPPKTTSDADRNAPQDKNIFNENLETSGDITNGSNNSNSGGNNGSAN